MQCHHGDKSWFVLQTEFRDDWSNMNVEESLAGGDHITLALAGAALQHEI